MDNPIRKNKKRGVTLIELVMALLLGAVIMVPLSMGFSFGLKSWNSNKIKSELIQHARVAMYRMTSELRYAESIVDKRSINNELEFATTHLIDADDGIENIIYRVESVPFLLVRKVMEDSIEISDVEVAGTNFGYIPVRVTNFTAKPMRIDSSGVLVENVLKPIEDTVAVQIDLTLECKNESITVTSLAKMRNR